MKEGWMGGWMSELLFRYKCISLEPGTTKCREKDMGIVEMDMLGIRPMGDVVMEMI